MNYKLLSGIHSIIKLSDTQSDRIIYLVGENHGNNGCDDTKNLDKKYTNYIDFYKKLFQDNEDKKEDGIFIDFFIESFYGDNPSYTNEGAFIEKLRYEFKDCTRPDKSNCNYNKLRVHWIDTRVLPSDHSKYFNKEEALLSLKEQKYEIDKRYMKELFEDDLVNFVKLLIYTFNQYNPKMVKSSLDKLLIAFIDSHPIINHQITDVKKTEDQKENSKRVLNKIKKGYSFILSNPYMISKILSDSSKDLKVSPINPLNSIKKIFNGFKITDNDDEIKSILFGKDGWGNDSWGRNGNQKRFIRSTIFNWFIGVTWKLGIDSYTIMRMFKLFKSSSQYPHTSNNIIVHAGHKHIQTIFLILSQQFNCRFLKNASYLQSPKNENCVDISRLNYPWFKERYKTTQAGGFVLSDNVYMIAYIIIVSILLIFIVICIVGNIPYVKIFINNLYDYININNVK